MYRSALTSRNQSRFNHPYSQNSTESIHSTSGMHKSDQDQLTTVYASHSKNQELQLEAIERPNTDLIDESSLRITESQEELSMPNSITPVRRNYDPQPTTIIHVDTDGTIKHQVLKPTHRIFDRFKVSVPKTPTTKSKSEFKSETRSIDSPKSIRELHPHNSDNFFDSHKINETSNDLSMQLEEGLDYSEVPRPLKVLQSMIDESNKDELKNIEPIKEGHKNVELIKEGHKNVELIKEEPKNIELIKEGHKNIELMKEEPKNVESINEETKNIELIKENHKNVELMKREPKNVESINEGNKNHEPKKEEFIPSNNNLDIKIEEKIKEILMNMLKKVSNNLEITENHLLKTILDEPVQCESKDQLEEFKGLWIPFFNNELYTTRASTCSLERNNHLKILVELAGYLPMPPKLYLFGKNKIPILLKDQYMSFTFTNDSKIGIAEGRLTREDDYYIVTFNRFIQGINTIDFVDIELPMEFSFEGDLQMAI